MIEAKQKYIIAIQGIAGSFHQLAAERFFGDTIDIMPCDTFNEVITKTTSSNSNLAVMAIENSIAGTILPNYNLIADSDLHIIGETYIKIEHHLMALPGVEIKNLKEIHSHPMALLQCEDFLHKLDAKLIEKSDTADSAKNIGDKKLVETAAVASLLAAKKYGLEILQKNIETDKHNYTRFLVLSKTSNKSEWPLCNKASIRFSLAHTSGSLAHALFIISEAKLNVSKIQSVPIIGKSWKYSFHLDVEFIGFSSFEKAVDELKNTAESLSILGIYKQGKND